MKLKEWLDYAAAVLETNFSKPQAYQEANYLAQAILGQLVERNTPLSLIAQKCLNNALEKRKKHIPLAKIIQKKEFYSKNFITTQDTLDPRPETEAIIDLVKIKPRSILDLGTGTGCLIITLLTQFPKASALGIDISPEALKIAKKNAQIHLGKLIKKINFLEQNWAHNLTGHFDLIVANPPYVKKIDNLEIALKYEPKGALFGDHTTYKSMFESLKDITFFQMLVEVPDELITAIVKQIDEFFSDSTLEIHSLKGTQISILNITNKTTDNIKNFRFI